MNEIIKLVIAGLASAATLAVVIKKKDPDCPA